MVIQNNTNKIPKIPYMIPKILKYVMLNTYILRLNYRNASLIPNRHWNQYFKEHNKYFIQYNAM